MAIDIKLTAHELYMAATVGVMRQVQNIARDRHQAYGADHNSDWQKHVEGALGEYAVAKYLDKSWNGNIGDLRASDVGSFQVRMTPLENGRLILHPKDNDEDFFIHVSGKNGTYRLHGWIRAGDGKKPEYWEDPSKANRPAFFVPLSKLNPIEQLKVKNALRG